MTSGYFVLDPITKEVREVEDVREWARTFGWENRLVALTVVAGKRVSTVFLGIDHSFGGDRLLLFETMIFPESGPDEEYCRRYATYAEAWNGHQELVWKIENGVNLED